MNTLCEQIVSLLGRSPDDQACRDFVRALGVNPQSSGRSYDFPTLGFCFICEKRTLSSVFFHIATPAVRAGSITAYSGSLPFGLGAVDGPEQVEGKIASTSLHRQFENTDRSDSTYFIDYFESSVFQLRVSFNLDTEHLRSISIGLKRTQPVS